MTGAGWSSVLFWWVAFAGSHLVLSSLAVRRPIIARLGDRGFQGLYSLVALATFVPLIMSYWPRRNTGVLLWNLREVPGLRELSILLSGLALIGMVLSLINPSAAGMMAGNSPRARGVTRITRHALFMALALWGLAHLLMNGWAIDVVFFGGFVIFAIVGGSHQDARKQATDDGSLSEFYAETSLLPFRAILSGRTRLVVAEISWVGVGVGIAAGVGIFLLHGRLF